LTTSMTACPGSRICVEPVSVSSRKRPCNRTPVWMTGCRWRFSATPGGTVILSTFTSGWAADSGGRRAPSQERMPLAKDCTVTPGPRDPRSDLLAMGFSVSPWGEPPWSPSASAGGSRAKPSAKKTPAGFNMTTIKGYINHPAATRATCAAYISPLLPRAPSGALIGSES